MIHTFGGRCLGVGCVHECRAVYRHACSLRRVMPDCQLPAIRSISLLLTEGNCRLPACRHLNRPFSSQDAWPYSCAADRRLPGSEVKHADACSGSDLVSALVAMTVRDQSRAVFQALAGSLEARAACDSMNYGGVLRCARALLPPLFAIPLIALVSKKACTAASLVSLR